MNAAPSDRFSLQVASLMRIGPLRDSLPEHAIVSGGMHMDQWPTLLVVDSDPHMLQTLVCYFEKRGFHVAASTNLAEAKAYFHRRKSWTLVLADYHLPDGNGWELCCWVHEQVQGTPVLLMSGSAHASTLCAGTDYLPKPFRLEALEGRVRELIQR
jgi:DNA-binding response OmpR family regulator